MKVFKLFTILTLLVVSCSPNSLKDSNLQNATESLDTPLEKESNLASKDSESPDYLNQRYQFPGPIKLFHVPKFQSTDCVTGFGLCFKIIIILFREEPVEIAEPSFNSSTGEVIFNAEIISENKIKLSFPNNIIESDSHNLEDFNNFNVTENTVHGDVTFLEGNYPLEVEDGKFNYTIDIEIEK